MKKNKVVIKGFIAVLILALIISSYLIYIHYSDSESSFCDISQGLSCDIVNKSLYSEFPQGSGIPVSILGFITFFLMLVIVILIKEDYSFKINKTKINKKVLIDFLIKLLIFSLLFAAYLVYVELYLILSICILCVALDILLLLMLYYSFELRRNLNEK